MACKCMHSQPVYSPSNNLWYVDPCLFQMFKIHLKLFRQQTRQDSSYTIYAHPFFAACLYTTAKMMGEKKEEVRISGTESLHPSENKNRAREYMMVRNTHVFLKDLPRLSESLEIVSSGSVVLLVICRACFIVQFMIINNIDKKRFVNFSRKSRHVFK